MAAEAAYRAWDARTAADFDYSTGHHHYSGTTVGIIKQYRADAVRATARRDAFQQVVDTSRDPLWTIAAVARQGSLYDSLCTGLLHANAMFSRTTQAYLSRSRRSHSLATRANLIQRVRDLWHETAARELDSALELEINRYATAIQLARRYHVDNAVVRRTLRRLDELEIEVGPARMREALKTVQGLEYTPGMFSAL